MSDKRMNDRELIFIAVLGLLSAYGSNDPQSLGVGGAVGLARLLLREVGRQMREEANG
jgi:hypothetical protein